MIRSQYMILAEHFREGLSGKFDVLGAFDRIWASGLPAQHPEMVIVASLVSESEDDLGKHSMRFYCMQQQTRQMLFEQLGEFVMKAEGGTWLGTVRLKFEFRGFPMTAFGKYRFVVEVDGREVADHLLTVAPLANKPKP
jgi:hypothetical protein